MFGYVVANVDQLSEENKTLYQSYYCGLCRTLKKQYGNLGRLTLNYDITFMILLLADLQDPETTLHRGRCVVHPAKERSMAENAVIEYGAAMNILLAYYNMMDDWKDEQKKTSYAAAKRLEKYIPAIRAQYPRQVKAVEEGMEALSKEENTPPADLDTAANIFGRLLGQLFVYQKDRWAEDCRRFGEALGRFVYWIDAYADLSKDRKKGSYNPMILLCDRSDYRLQVETMLKDTLGECALILERLPLVEHLDILRNVLYSGIWSKFEGEKEKE
ncbi:MAG: hypothetical protein IJP27_05975 [Clostridia bacterium]|nr:hypothetical protein [Clostridia bacterium]